MAVKIVPLAWDEVFVRPAPPAELAGDVERLAVWKHHVQEDVETFLELRYVNITGCGTNRGYLCWESQTGDEGGWIMDCTMSDAAPDEVSGKFKLKPRAWSSLKAHAVP
jgi:hypothetical protein